MDTGNQESASKKKVPRLYHTKSRKGCERCRARRVKCDEKLPACSSCARHGVPCAYKATPAVPTTTSGGSDRSSSIPLPFKRPPDLLPSHAIDTGLPTPDPFTTDPIRVEKLLSNDSADSDVFDIPESKSRRLLELRLLQNYVSNCAPSFPACHNPEAKYAWTVDVPHMAMEYDNLLYGIFAISALQLVRTDPANAELIVARQNYFGLSLREHRKAVAQLDRKSADSVCFASTLILIDAFSSLQDRTVEPYSPPLAWINMARGVGLILRTSLDSIKHYETSTIMKVVNAYPRLADNDVLFAESNRKKLAGLLSQDIAPGQEVWDKETREIYEKTLSYIGGCQIAVKDHEHPLANCRRMMAFANLVPAKFLTFVEEQRPRALAVLAHFFALSAGLENLWWIRDTGRREIGGIQNFLPDEWQELIRFPVGVTGLIPR